MNAPSSVWVVCDKDGDCLFSDEHRSIAEDHFQHCVENDSDFRAGPYTLTEYVPKRDLAAAQTTISALTIQRDGYSKIIKMREEELAAAQSELASVKAHAEAMAVVLERLGWVDPQGNSLKAYRAANPKEGT